MADLISGFRQIVQDLLVPELKAVQVELKHHSEQLEEMNKHFDALHEEMNRRFSAVDKRLGMLEQRMQRLEAGQEKILDKLDLDKRVSRIEYILDTQRKQSLPEEKQVVLNE